MQHLDGSGSPVLYIERTVLKGEYDNSFDMDVTGSQSYPLAMLNFRVFLLPVIGRITIPQMNR